MTGLSLGGELWAHLFKECWDNSSFGLA